MFWCHWKPLGWWFWTHGRRLMLKSIPLDSPFRLHQLKCPPPPQPSKDCPLTVPSPLPCHYHSIKLSLLSFQFFGALWWLSLSSLQVFWAQWWHLKFFWGSVCDGILSFLGLCVMPWWAAGSSTDWLPSLGSHLRLFSLARSQFYRISKYFGGNLILKCLTGPNESNHKKLPISCFRHPVPKELQSTVYRAALRSFTCV